jgi:hypothetical protein
MPAIFGLTKASPPSLPHRRQPIDRFEVRDGELLSVSFFLFVAMLGILWIATRRDENRPSSGTASKRDAHEALRRGRFSGMQSAVEDAQRIAHLRRADPRYEDLVVAARIVGVYERHFMAFGLLALVAVGSVLLRSGPTRLSDLVIQLNIAEGVIAIGTVIAVVAPKRFRAVGMIFVSPIAAAVVLVVLAVQSDVVSWISESALVAASLGSGYRIVKIVKDSCDGNVEVGAIGAGVVAAGYFAATLVAYFLVHGPLWIAGRYTMSIFGVAALTALWYGYGPAVGDPADPETLG